MVFDGEFDVPERRYATGAAYVRGLGAGRVKAIHGLEQAQREVGPLVGREPAAEARRRRSPRGYEGAGYVILRHPETAVVEQGLQRIVEILAHRTGVRAVRKYATVNGARSYGGRVRLYNSSP